MASEKKYPCPGSNYLAVHGKYVGIEESERHTNKLKSWLSCPSKNDTGREWRQMGSELKANTRAVHPQMPLHFMCCLPGTVWWKKPETELKDRSLVERTSLLEDWVNFTCFILFFLGCIGPPKGRAALMSVQIIWSPYRNLTLGW